ncbi:hypothetical protein H7F51_13260 [Novosphingobium flavum]|uniref:Uncharacterized protein n=1 Tax=Novosphingobium flavum TaxID=1778672 RepID=A0A7X1FT45_9SPHN|nr:hypothetical protein [Novosphingobium flavum]MBC2666490.1 hypothetical protein [Novosphingobium flavum]
MISRTALTLLAAAGLAACSRQPAPEPVATSSPESIGETAESSAPPPSATPTAAPAPAPAASQLILREWRKAENRHGCAPLALPRIGSRRATPRRAAFSGGWAVAWDEPGLRSAFGIAGAGLIGMDDAPPGEQRARLARQWPLFRELEQLPSPSFAGYGIEGAGAYPDDNPEGKGLNSLAYVRVGGQTCTYNIWSRLGRAHLEYLLENLTMLEPAR